MNFEELLEKYKVPIGIGLVGLVLVSFGILLFSLQRQAAPEIEILTEEEAGGMIWVDLQGAVEKPGVYELPADSRINDLLVAGGGLSAQADREWVAANINRAQKLVDGQKLFIPSQDSPATIAGASTAGSAGKQDLPANRRVSINTATAAELDTLWGIGEARAKAIIDNRPYQTLEELKSKAKIPSNVYERIKDQITVW